MTGRYQGYPYVNPIVTDAPSLDAATAAKWANLPRKVLSPTAAGPSGSGLGGSRGNQASSSSQPSIPPKRDSLDDNPVVYIDLPEAGGNDVCMETPEEEEPQYVQDTILYDPFENRRITTKDDSRSEQSSISDTSGPTMGSSRPARPDTLDIMSPASSSSQSPMTNTRPGLPSFMEKESIIYGGQGPDGFPMSPIPISQFPEPPPAYTELAPPRPQFPPREQVSPERPPPPRTEVIVPAPDPISPVGLINYDRKNLTCHHCGARVHSLVIRENGYMTHVIGFLTFLFMIPLVLVVYFTDHFKHKNHYCPNCNRVIAYELPMCSNKNNNKFFWKPSLKSNKEVHIEMDG